MKSNLLLKKVQALTIEKPPSSCILPASSPGKQWEAYNIPIASNKHETAVDVRCAEIKGK
jgi:hypothetical protein